MQQSSILTFYNIYIDEHIIVDHAEKTVFISDMLASQLC